MKLYSPDLPLVFAHIPKTAGASVSRIFEDWFGEGYVRNYFNHRTNEPPVRSDVFDRHTPEAPVCVYGHFNPERGFGVQDTYPDAKQFMTIMRDPFERAVSGYYYMRSLAPQRPQFAEALDTTLADHLATTSPKMLLHFPRPMTADNYKDIIDEFFVMIGFSETLVPSLHTIAASLGRDFDPALLGHKNKGNYKSEIEDIGALQAAYQTRHPLEFDVYNYAKERFSGAHISTGF